MNIQESRPRDYLADTCFKSSAALKCLCHCGGFGTSCFYVVGKPGSKPHKACQLDKEVGVLISGCADQETSADAQDPIRPGKAYGAMTNALVTVVRQHYDQYPSTPLTNRYAAQLSLVLMQGQKPKTLPLSTVLDLACVRPVHL